MNRKWFVIFIIIAMGTFIGSGARADIGDFIFGITQTLPQNYGNTAGTTLNPEGRGDALIFPYYDVREINGKTQDFYFAIINDDGACGSSFVQCQAGIAVQMHFREWDKGEEVMGFSIWLSRGDVWVGMLSHDTILAPPYGARITSPDWVIINNDINTFTLAKPLATGLDFPTAAQIPPGSSNLMGYLEVIGEEKTFDHEFSSNQIYRVSRSRDLGTGMYVDAPNSLLGKAYIIRIADGQSFGYNAKAIANFSRNQGSLFDYPGSIHPTLLDCEDSLDELEFQISKREVIADYNIDPAVTGKSSLIVTFPTKHFHFCQGPNYTIKGDITASCSATYPLGPPWTARQADAPEPARVTIHDQAESSVVFPGLRSSPSALPFAVNVIGLYQGTSPAVPVAGNRDNVAWTTTTFDKGYLSVAFPNWGYVQPNNPKITKLLFRDDFLGGYGGLPTLGLVLQESENAAVGGFYGSLRDVFYETEWSKQAVSWGSISGQVTRQSDGGAIPNVVVNVYDDSWNWINSSATDSSGNYTVAGLATGDYFVGTWNNQGYIDGYFSNALWSWDAGLVGVTAGLNTTGINFGLSMSSISGRVTRDSDGAGIEGIEIDVYDSSWNYISFTMTDSTGDYNIGGLPTGNYYLRTYAIGYVDEYYNDIQVAGSSWPPAGVTAVSVTSGVNTSGINFGLSTGGSISGRVTRNSDGNGIQNVWVIFYDGNWNYVQEAQTDASGNYTVSGLPTGSYYLRTSNSQNYIDEYYNDIAVIGGSGTRTLVSVTTGSNTPNINFGLNLGGSISGRVTRNSDGNGIQNVQVPIYDGSWNYVTSAWTNSTGNYAVYGLPVGNYYLRTYATGYVNEYYNDIQVAGSSWPPAGVTAVGVTAGGNTSGIDFGLSTGGSISGRVTRNSDGNGIQNVWVVVSDSNWNYVNESQSNASGNYTVTGLPTGSYYVWTSNSQNYIDENYNDIQRIGGSGTPTLVGVTAGSNTPNINFGLTLGGSISGRVTRNSDGNGIQNVRIQFYDGSWNYVTNAWTNSTGNYTAYGLPVGNYYLRTYATGYADEYYNDIQVAGSSWPPAGVAPVSVTAGSDAGSINFGLSMVGSISGRVTRDLDGAGIQGAWVRVYSPTWSYVTGVSTNPSGNYTVGGLTPGNYYVMASGTNYMGEYYDNTTNSSSATLVTVSGGSDTSGIDFSLATLGSISGRVTRSPDGSGIANVEVQVYASGWTSVGSSKTDALGYYVIDGLYPDAYYIGTFNNQGYTDKFYNNVVSTMSNRGAAGQVSAVLNSTTPNIDFNLAHGYSVEKVSSYKVDPGGPYSYVAGTTQVLSFLDGCDDGYFEIDLQAIGFDFRFYGNPARIVRVSTNGLISFDGSAPNWLDILSIPNPTVPNNFAAPFWDDLYLCGLTGGRGLWYGVLGGAPNRQLVIEWRGVSSYQFKNETYSFEAILQETADKIKFQYQDVDSGTSHDSGALAAVGIENFDGTAGVQYSFQGSSPLSNGLAIEFVPRKEPNLVDFDGDLKTDVAVYRAGTGAWFVRPSDGTSVYGVGFGGDPSDSPVPGDYDGDGKIDIALYRKSTGAWFIYPSSTGPSGIYGVGFGGSASDIPVPADYDGDGKTDLAIYRKSTGAWFIYPSSTGPSGIYGVGFGGDASDIPVPGDYDGDGKTDLAIYRKSTGAWFIYPSSTGSSGIYGVGFGGDPSDIPVPGDYDGDGKTDLAIYRKSTGAWFIYPSSTGSSGIYGVGFGGDPSDIPVPGDYDGDGKTDLAIYRPSLGAWFIYPSSTGPSGIYGVGFGGDASDIPVTMILPSTH